MAVDTPATIAVIGAGPIGLEAALYARFLGYDVLLYERARIAENLIGLANQPGETSWNMHTSPLGIAALAAQRPDWQPPTLDAALSAQELVETYFLPLSQTDLLADCIKLHTEVLSVERDNASEGPGLAEDDVPGFLLRVRDAGGERIDTVDVVIDASGAVNAARDNDPLYGTLRLSDAPTKLPTMGNDDDRARLVTSEPDLYILGVKSASVPAEFRIRDGLVQIRDLFTIIADRATLDLYGTFGTQ